MFTLSIKRWLVLLAGVLMFSSVQATVTEPSVPDTFAKNKVTLQISDPNPFKQTLVLNVASNLKKHYGDDVDIEIVAFGPGVRLMLASNTNKGRMDGLMTSGVRFSACNNTLGKFAKKLGKKPEVMEGVTVVPGGAVRIMQLSSAGWQLLKP